MVTLRQRSFDDLGAPLSEVPYCVLDLETTGLSPDSCEITEIGAISYMGGVETGRFQTLVNPRLGIPPRITIVTGITQAMVIDAPTIEEVLPTFLSFIGDSVIVGHNVRFDISFLNAAALRMGYDRLPNQSADTLALARRLIRGEVRDMKLSSLAAHLGSPTAPNHRAFDDALATAHVFWELLERAGSIGVTHLDDLLALPTIKGSRAIGKLVLTENLPRSPGVYTFRDRAGESIYIGKATNLRARVRSYFAGDHRRRIDAILRDLETIDHIQTTNELEASVLELRMIDACQPRYNRRSRRPRSLHWLRLTKERYPRLSIGRSPGDGLLRFGPFRSRRAAESAMHAMWDASHIRRCTSPGRGCTFAQLGVTVCPCDGSVDDSDYAQIVDNLVVGLRDDPASLLAMTNLRLKSLVTRHRFEEAAKCRDNWALLARTLQRERAWDTLQRAGVIIAKRDGASIAIAGGRMVATWSSDSAAPPMETDDTQQLGPPATMVEADEADLLWKWLTTGGTELIDVSADLSVPTQPIPALVSV